MHKTRDNLRVELVAKTRSLTRALTFMPSKSRLKYYAARILSALVFMGSFDVGIITGAEYGKAAGWISFIAIAVIGIYLHFVANRIQSGVDRQEL